MSILRKWLRNTVRDHGLSGAVPLAVLALCIGLPSLAMGDAWSPTGSLNTGRDRHTATLLLTGKVLVTGGYDGNSILASAELYDATTGKWSTTGSMKEARRNHTATRLPNGFVLVAGGHNGTSALASAELYDPATGRWSYTGSMPQIRAYHTDNLLSNGQVMLTSGATGFGFQYANSVFYSPATGTWPNIVDHNSNPGRVNHTTTLLINGRVLLVGGGNPFVEVYYNGRWQLSGGIPYPNRLGCANHTATRLSGGQVLVAGGMGDAGLLTSAYLYDPATDRFSATGPLNTARQGHKATLLTTGKVLVMGGYDDNGPLASSELYDPSRGKWFAAASLVEGRYNHTATFLSDGKILVAGGYNFTGGYLTSAEVYIPDPKPPSPKTTPATSLLLLN